MVQIDPFPGTAQKVRVGKLRSKWMLTKEQEAWLRKWHSVCENKILERLSGISHSTMARFIRELGLSKKDSDGFKEIMQRKGEKMSETRRKEERRIRWGLPQQTRLYIPMKKYNCAQLSCRAHALEKGYILAADYKEGSPDRWVIFYDKDTPRDEVFEKNCEKNQFEVKEWKD